MEQYSIAFAHSIATRARCKMENLRVDDEQVDVTIRQKASHTTYDACAVDVQLKCTHRDVLHADGVHFPLPRNQYDGLRNRSYLPKILVTLLVSEDFDQWMSHSPNDLLLRGQAYWMSTAGLPAITSDSKTVILPSANRFDADQLLDMLQRIGNGGTP